ncbi:MAG: thioredoxin family protein [Paludibacter sp.]|nr:thioredoxin family protein [Paludibacter sp.]
MKIIIAATKTCTHRPKLEEQLKDAGLQYEVVYFEDHPGLIEEYKLKISPLLIVDDIVVSVGMPEHSYIIELKNKTS